MRARLATDKNCTGYASEFNTHSAHHMEEVLFYCEQFGIDSVFTRTVEVQLSDNSWVNLKDALEQKVVVPDHHNLSFMEVPSNE